MPSKPHIFLPIVLVGGIAVVVVWQSFSKLQNPPEALDSRPKKQGPRWNSQSGEFISRKTASNPADEDLLAIYQRDGAAAALAAAKSQPWPKRDNSVYFILMRMAIDEPEMAAAELKTSGLNASFRGSVIDTILKHWQDGKKALDWADKQLTGELRGKAIPGALGILAKAEPDAAFAYFEEMPASTTRRQAICDLFAAWASDEPEAALMNAQRLTPKESELAIEYVIRGWAKSDPESAAAWILKAAPANGTWLAIVYQSWITRSPEKAGRWYESLPEGDAKKNAPVLNFGSSGTASILLISPADWTIDHSWSTKKISERNATDLMNWANQDTEGAREFVEQNGNDPASNQLTARIAMAISNRTGLSAAVDWTLQLSVDNEIRVQALDPVIYELSQKDPAAVGVELESMTPEQYGKLPLIFVNSWVRQDPAAAADWVMQWKGGNQPLMIEDVIDIWSDQDSSAAYQWLGNLPAGAGRDAGIKSMIQREKDSAPDTLRPWIDLISNSDLKEKTLRKLSESMNATPRK